MSQTSEPSTSTTLVATLPERAATRNRASFDPRGAVWEWYDGPFKMYIDFRRVTGEFEAFVLPLKMCLLPFAKGYSSSYVKRLFEEFIFFTKAIGKPTDGSLNAQHLSDYAVVLGPAKIERLGCLNALLQKWVALGLAGVAPECATYLQERRKPGGKKGEPVRTRDPVEGPFNEAEYTALYAAVNDAYGRGDLPLWTLLLTRLLFACGGRISQYASLKIGDFDSATYVLNLPQAKTREEHARSMFLSFDISPQTSRLIADYFEMLRADSYDQDSAFFPESLVMPMGPHEERREVGDMFYGHCLGDALAGRFKIQLAGIAPLTARLDFAPIPIKTRRFRYTFGMRLAEEGASKVVIANRLGHADLQHVDVYVGASPNVIENIDKAMGPHLAPLARAFRGQLVEDEDHTTHQGAPGSRIIDFRVSKEPVGSCAGKGSGCAFNKPVACYSCFRFEPWLDAPHEKVLQRLLTEREKWSADDRMAAVNDESVRAVREVIAECAQVWQQRGQESSEANV